MADRYRHSLRIRYGECDMQRVVFNANYMAYVDDAVDTWVRDRVGSFEVLGFDFMLKRAVFEWQGPATFGDTLDLDLGVDRWGNTSFDVLVEGTAAAKEVFTATLTYVSVVPKANTPTPVPAEVREALSR
jgi:acyl-CoA thioester hydrolase